MAAKRPRRNPRQSPRLGGEGPRRIVRRAIRAFVRFAVRELVAKALIHQDFTESGTSVMVETRQQTSLRYRNYVPFWA